MDLKAKIAARLNNIQQVKECKPFPLDLLVKTYFNHQHFFYCNYFREFKVYLSFLLSEGYKVDTACPELSSEEVRLGYTIGGYELQSFCACLEEYQPEFAWNSRKLRSYVYYLFAKEVYDRLKHKAG